MIRSLSLSVPRAIPFDEDFTLPDTVLTGDTPYLRRLKLHRVNINWNSRFLRGLTHLSIHGVATFARPTTNQLMNALERMPALEVFDIQDALPLPPYGPSADCTDLPRLVLLSVTSTVPGCVNFVSILTIPADARVHLSCSGTETTGADFSGVMRVISSPRSITCYQEKDTPSERNSIRVLHVQHESPVGLVVHGWTSALAPHEADPQINVPDIQLHFSWHHSPHITAGSVTTSVCKAISIAPLCSLRIAYVDDISPEIWIDTFGLLLKLHSVHILGHSAHAFVSALREEASFEALTSPSITPQGSLGVRRPGLCQRRTGVPSVYFPQLRSLTGEGDSSQMRLTFRNFQNCMIERYNRKAEIQKLCLRECSHLCTDDIQTLRAFVTVDLDGVEQGFSEEWENG